MGKWKVVCGGERVQGCRQVTRGMAPSLLIKMRPLALFLNTTVVDSNDARDSDVV